MSYRRNLKNGVSEGKIAGVMLFRLIKTPCVFPIIKNDADKEYILFFNNFLAISFIFKKFLGINQEDIINKYKRLVKEISFSITYRHTNQETLGMIFDLHFC